MGLVRNTCRQTAFALLLTSATAVGQTVPSGYQADYLPLTLGSFCTTMAFIDADEFFVLEKDGHVKHVQFPGPFVTTVLTLSVVTSGERGLLGIALHPDFANTSRVYLYYTNSSPVENRIVSYQWDGSDLVSPTAIATLPSASLNHNGGIILFGPDGKLYAVIGDLNRNEMTENFSNEIVSDTSVILRLNDDGTTPNDNPFTTPGWERYFAYGVRNSFGMAFDPITGHLWDTENGLDNYDEINRVVPGMNSGWEDIMGPDDRDPQGVADLVMIPGAEYVDPAFSWVNTAAPTAIRFLNSCRWPASLWNDCFVLGYHSFKLYHFNMTNDRTEFVLSDGLADKVADDIDDIEPVVWADLGFPSYPLTDIQIGPDGYMYVVNFRYILRIRPINPMGDVNLDGNVTMDDMPLFTSFLLAKAGTPEELAVADFDGDGSVTGMDIPCFVTSLQMPN